MPKIEEAGWSAEESAIGTQRLHLLLEAMTWPAQRMHTPCASAKDTGAARNGSMLTKAMQTLTGVCA